MTIDRPMACGVSAELLPPQRRAQDDDWRADLVVQLEGSAERRARGRAAK